MSQPFAVTTKNQRTGESTRISGEFSSEEWAQILLYLGCFGKLARCRMAESRAELSWGMSWSRAQPVEYQASFPPDDDIWAFLHCMRPFVLQDDPSFYQVRNVVARRIAIDAVRDHLERLKAVYNGTAMGFSIECNGMLLNSDQTVDLWLNAFEYHPDQDKRAELRAMFAVFPEPAVRALFLQMMLARASAVQQLAEFLEQLRAKDGLERLLTVA